MKIMSQYIGSTGYYMVTLHNSATKKIKPRRVHRLLATNFMPNPKNKPHLNHKDGVLEMECQSLMKIRYWK